MDTVETVMAEQLDAIIRRLSARIDESAGGKPLKGQPSIGRMKKNLGRVRDIRAHFATAQ